MSLLVTTANSSLKQTGTPQIGAALTTVAMLVAVYTSGMAFPIQNQQDTIRTISAYRNQSIQSCTPGYNGTTINLAGSFDMRYSDTIKKLRSFLDLSENWNGYGACKFSHQLVQQAIEMVRGFPVQPEVYPISNGSIQFEFEKTHGEYLEFELGENQSISVFRIAADGSEQEYQTNFDTEELARLVKDFYE